MTDDRPRPKYGEYAPIPPVTAAAPVPAPVVVEAEEAPATAPRRRTWDLILTTTLLLVGVYDVVVTYPQFADLAAGLGTVYSQQGVGDFTSDALATSMGTAINVSRIVILGIAIGLTLWSINRHRISFWIPLSAGVLAGLIVTVCVCVVVVTDPALAQYVAEQSAAS